MVRIHNKKYLFGGLLVALAVATLFAPVGAQEAEDLEPVREFDVSDEGNQLAAWQATRDDLQLTKRNDNALRAIAFGPDGKDLLLSLIHI